MLPDGNVQMTTLDVGWRAVACSTAGRIGVIFYSRIEAHLDMRKSEEAALTTVCYRFRRVCGYPTAKTRVLTNMHLVNRLSASYSAYQLS